MEITLPSFVDYPDGALAQWKSHRFYKLEVPSSNPGWNQSYFQFK